jgi:hypothetical protein
MIVYKFLWTSTFLLVFFKFVTGALTIKIQTCELTFLSRQDRTVVNGSEASVEFKTEDAAKKTAFAAGYRPLIVVQLNGRSGSLTGR